jgi:hypothetical protein
VHSTDQTFHVVVPCANTELQHLVFSYDELEVLGTNITPLNYIVDESQHARAVKASYRKATCGVKPVAEDTGGISARLGLYGAKCNDNSLGGVTAATYHAQN